VDSITSQDAHTPSASTAQRNRSRNDVAPRPRFASLQERNESFARALETLRAEVESRIGEEDAAHIRRVGKLSQRLELLGRGLLQISFEPLGFGLGTAALTVHKALELMEIGHMALHGAYDGLPDTERFASTTFRWKSPVDEASWRVAHNVRHHQYTNIQGRDPDLDFGALRLSARVPYRPEHAFQPVTNFLSWLGFGTALNLHATGMLDIHLKTGEPENLRDRQPATVRAAKRAFTSKLLRYFGREYVFFPLLAGPFFPKVLLGNILSEVGRDTYAAAVIYCGHVGASDYPHGTEANGRAEWYVMQAEAARDVEVPEFISILSGALDKQIEHHLFPRLPPNRLREIAPRVRAICEEHGVIYRSASWPKTLRSVLGELRRLSSSEAMPTEATPPAAALDDVAA
jgi:fatty acid desaturase